METFITEHWNIIVTVAALILNAGAWRANQAQMKENMEKLWQRSDDHETRLSHIEGEHTARVKCA